MWFFQKQLNQQLFTEKQIQDKNNKYLGAFRKLFNCDNTIFLIYLIGNYYVHIPNYLFKNLISRLIFYLYVIFTIIKDFVWYRTIYYKINIHFHWNTLN